MELVCQDVNGPSTWFYDGGKYYRKNEAGEVYRTICGEQLPDPVALWEKRKSIRPINMNAVKPQDATFALYEHWKGVKNANLNT